MSQREVYEFLKKNKDNWFTLKEIAEGLGINSKTTPINVSLRKLRYSGLIQFKNRESRQGYIYKCKMIQNE